MLDYLNVLVGGLDVFNNRWKIFENESPRRRWEPFFKSNNIMAATTANINNQRTICRGIIQYLLLNRKPVGPVSGLVPAAFHEGIETV